MCDHCWDLDRREFALKRSGCDGNLKPFMTVNELKSKLYEKWLTNKQTDHVVIKDAVINPPTEELKWEHHLENQRSVTLSVKFV